MSSGSVLRSKPVCLIPQRYIISIVVSVAAILLIGQFMYIRTAIDYIEPYPNQTSTNITLQNKAAGWREELPVIISDKQFDWTSDDVTQILHLYTYGFYSVQVPAGVLADKVGGKMLLEISVALTSILTLITPGVLRLIDGNTKISAGLMFFVGFTGGAGYPAIFSILGNWSPKAERCRMTSFTFAAISASVLLDWSFNNYLIDKSDSWGTVFYLYGAVGVLWSLLWYFLGASRPSASKYIDENELNFLKNGAERHITSKKKIPVWSMLKSLPLWVLFGLEIFLSVILIGIIDLLPRYIEVVLGYGLNQRCKVLALGGVILIVSTVAFCWLSDFIVARDYIHITTMRRIFATFGIMGPSVFLLTQTYTSKWSLGISTLVTSTVLILVGCAFVGIAVNFLDLAPNFSGTLKGLLTLFDLLSIFLVRFVATEYAPNNTWEEWKEVQWVMFYLGGVFSLLFMVFGSGEEQSWNVEHN